jgi:hypothetical protein
LEIRKTSLENVFKSRNEAKKSNDETKNEKEKEKEVEEEMIKKKKEKSLCVCRCDLCVFENSPEKYLNSSTEHSLEHSSDHSTEDSKERSMELEPRFRVLGDQYMQQGRVTVAISLYTAAILNIQIKLKKIFSGEQILFLKKSENSSVKKKVEGYKNKFECENENENENGKENGNDYEHEDNEVIAEEKHVNNVEEDEGEKEEKAEEVEENVVGMIDGLSSLYYSLGAAVLDCKHPLSLSLPTPSLHSLSFPSVPLPLPLPAPTPTFTSLPPPTPFLHTLPLPAPVPAYALTPILVSSPTPTLTPNPFPVTSLHGTSSNWRKGHDIWKIGDKITKKWYKLHEKTQIKNTKYRSALTMQIEKLYAYDYLNLSNGSHTGRMDGDKMQGSGGEGGGGGQGVLEGGRSLEERGGIGGGQGEGGSEQDKKKDNEEEDKDKMRVRNKDEKDCIKGQKQNQDQDERLKGLNIHISRGLISEMECERAIQWAEEYATALPLPLALPLTLPLPSSSSSLLPSVPSSSVLPSSFADIHKEKTTTTVSNPASTSTSTHPSHSHPLSTPTPTPPSSSSSNGWTTTRHYAVPTTDLPIHIIPPFLHWFNSVMQNRLAPLLRKQFLKGYGRVSVHDAFIVKYEHNQSDSFPSSSSSSSSSSSYSFPFSSSTSLPPSSSTSSSSFTSSTSFLPTSSSTSSSTSIASSFPSSSSSSSPSSSTTTSQENLGSKHGIKPSLTSSIFDCLSHPLSSSQRHLPLHTDESTHSLIIALNSKEGYLGGGTFFADLNSTVRPGVCLCVCAMKFIL